MQEESDFHRHADAMLAHLYSQLEAGYERGDYEELDLTIGILKITTRAGLHFIINKHTASRQIWLASPISGGKHFAQANDGAWRLADGGELGDYIRRELGA